MGKRLVVINATLLGDVHEVIDASMIIMGSMTFERVDVYFNKKRANIIRQLISRYHPCTNVQFHPLKVIVDHRCAIHDLFAAIQEIYLLLFHGRKQNTIYYFSYVNMFSCHVINFISKVTGKKICINCHSELAVITKQRIPYKDYWCWLINHFYMKAGLAKNLRLIVLGDYIKENLSAYMSSKRLRHFVSIDHAYFSVKNKKAKLLSLNIVKIGIIGSVSDDPGRGFDNILKVSKIFANQKNVELSIISKIKPDLINKLPNTVKVYSKNNEYLPRDKYDRLIEELDYIFIPYSADSFKFAASGAVLEAIFKKKPVLMYSNHYFNYLDRKLGHFGYFLDKGAFNWRKLKDKTQYALFSQHIEDIIEQLSPEYIVTQYRRIIDSFKSFS